MDINTKLLVTGSVTTLGEFSDSMCEGDIELATRTIKAMINNGNAKLLEPRKTKTEIIIEKSLSQQDIMDRADYIKNSHEKKKDRHAQVKRDGRLVHEEISIDCYTLEEARDYKALFEEKLRIKSQVSFADDQDIFQLILFDVTDKDIDYISRAIKRDSIVNGGVNLVDKGLTGSVNAVDYTAKNVISPTVTIGAKSVASIGRTLFNTIARTGSTIITSGAEGIRKTSAELKQDEELAKAQAELVNSKNAIVRNIKNRTGSRSNSRINF